MLAPIKISITTKGFLKAANWSSETISRRFYHKEVERVAYRRVMIADTKCSSENSLGQATNNTVPV